MNHPFVNLLVRWLILALGVGLSATLVPGIDYSDGTTLAFVVVLLSLFNAVLKPFLVLFTLPFIVLTMGIGVWLINAVIFFFVGRLVEGFHVAGFGAALLGALVVSLTNLFLTGLLRGASTPKPPRNGGGGSGASRKADDVIDV
ncbi:MAG: phage holin family protein [Candidatus Didemnitutus sp.]|nr:phage holin family protein [Candidatus Didemnitutus sp.]